MPAPESVITALEARMDSTLEALIELARIPSISAAGYPAAELERSAEAVAALCRAAGCQDAEVVRVPAAHPAVLARCAAAEPDRAATVLIYAHHDVQPPGRPERWRSPPFEPTLRGDGRLYGRGVVDDKAGLLLHLAALRAWVDAQGAPPLNVQLVVEGEEETGSEHLGEFLRAQRERLRADALVLSDTQNLATGLPSITTSLRGIVQIDVHVRALDHPIHSGMWGGPLIDAASALSVILARLFDAEGGPAVPGLDDDAPQLTREERARLAALPLDEAALRADTGLLDGVRVKGLDDGTFYERLWFRPAIAVLALDAMPLAQATNQLVAEARARVSVRVAPGQDPRRVADCVVALLTSAAPAGVRVEARVGAAVPGWRRRDESALLAAGQRALAAGFGRESVRIGCGGTIPFVGAFAEALPDVPDLLLGLEDPACNAHGENESLDLADFRRAARSSAHLLAELAALHGRGR